MSRAARSRRSNIFSLSPSTTLHLLSALLLTLSLKDVISTKEIARSDGVDGIEKSNDTEIFDIGKTKILAAGDSSREYLEKLINSTNYGEIGNVDKRTVLSNASGNAGESSVAILNLRGQSFPKISDSDGRITTTRDKNELVVTKSGLDYDAEDDEGSTGRQRTTDRANLEAKVGGEAPFLGFVGSQKFPVRPTYKPLPPPEKFDRRHFGLAKPETEESGSSGSTSEPDLPKSPSRDVGLHNPKVERREDGLDSNSTAVGPEATHQNSSAALPGTSPGLRALGTMSNASLFDGKNETLPGSGAGSRTGGVRGSFEANLENLTLPKTPAVRIDDFGILRDLNGGFESVRNRSVGFANGRTRFGDSEGDKINVTILGLFELTQGNEPRPEGLSELQAARLAVERINQMDKTPRFRIHLVHNDTKCDPGVGVDRFFHALYSRRDALMPLLLGTACSEVTETLAKIVPYWSIAQVSFGSTAPALSDATEFPLFRRTVAPDSSHNPARIALIKHLGWDTVTALSQNGDMYSLAVNDLVTELEQANITCTATITFAANDYKEQLRTLKELDTRIIIASFSPVLAPRVFCEAWKLGMHGGDYAWILPGDAVDLSGVTGEWWHTRPEDCSSSELASTLDGLVIVKSHTVVLGPRKSDAGWTTAEFTTELAARGVTLSRYAAQTFDAVWAMALALSNAENYLNHRNISMAEYTHGRRDLADHILRQLSQLEFMGVSGPVSFKGADRIGISAFYQMHGHTLRRIAIYTPTNGSLTMTCAGCATPQWPGEHPPAARRVCRLRVVTVAPGVFLAVACLASVGATLALAFLAFNLHFRKHKSIKLSSPKLNNIAAVGCALVYGAVILLGLDDATLSDSDAYFPIVCTARVYLLSAGFSLAFGSMFTKTYRVHRIFTRSRSGVVKNKLLQDTQLISLIFVLLLIDGLVVTLWVTLDPMQRHLRNLTLDISSQDRGVVYQPQVEVCRSQHTNGWLGALYAYKGLLLVVGVYMAWETRHVKIPALNDSQYIGMSVYSVVITSVIVVVLANLMSDRATLAFVTITALILASTTSTLALLFLPQLANILAGERADPVVQSLGLKIECNTRRFVTDDRRELQYRVEVQNRVYRKEMAQLELELARLEKQLGEEPPGPSQASSNASIPQRNPSIGGGLPLLLLSVLPPVIPRASWPSADPSGMRRGTVAFSSQPDLEDGPRRSLADIYKLHQRRETEGPNRLGVFNRLFSLFGSRPNSRKTSTASFTGVASALRVHMGYIAGLVPGTKAASTCQVDTQGTRPPHPRCGSGPIISITSEEDRRLSLGLQRKECSEPRVNFTLPPHSSASQSSSREKIRGSPRFPHRIVPANSLGTISTLSPDQPQRWRSMEVAATSPKPTQIPRGVSLSPNCDVWATSEVGIPLSELANSARGRKPPETLPLTIPAVSDASPNSWLGSDLRMLFGEQSPGDCHRNDDVSPEIEGSGIRPESGLTVPLIVSSDPVSDSNTESPIGGNGSGFLSRHSTPDHHSPKVIAKALQEVVLHPPGSSEVEGQRRVAETNGNEGST
ncbi:gamma-aminobutyric acid type B receptor subunit 2 isoform X1 [Neodiprion fabricii]|uniref:gamma-aminobutyric acid type B receptor subunit 2 isoform X1 n=1 Tax=Neodiprion fabricii TaxID=2872261 RepID=UPI001ED95B90|nr:gamma-aminobutyric acid type B receptor subunit 2 isoform X1 [Neodiprion fabricii]XP_046416569.1 gamma-aminobutyric acid type B receptor subunit 2 isoform X1 [Neodiprion fabricii]